MSSKPRNRCQKTTWTACRKQAVFFPSPGCHPLLKRAGCSRTVRRYLTISMEIFLILKASAFSANPGRHKKSSGLFVRNFFCLIIFFPVEPPISVRCSSGRKGSPDSGWRTWAEAFSAEGQQVLCSCWYIRLWRERERGLHGCCFRCRQGYRWSSGRYR